MKKLNLLFTFILICVLMSSCDTGISFNGKVVDKKTHQPLAGVKISVKDIYFTSTDSLGRYNYGKLNYGWFGDTEILLEKEGYQPKHLNLNYQKDKQFNAIIELEKSAGQAAYSIDRKYVKTMYYFNMYVLSLINILTLIFVCVKKKIVNRYLWIIGILLFNLTFFFSITDFSLINFHILNGPVYMMHYRWYPYSLKLVIPVATILFWVFYLVKREYVIEEVEAIETI